MKHVLKAIEQFKNVPFAWGTADCCTFAGFYIELKTGEDLRSAYGNYKTELGAKKAQVKHGTFEGLLDSKFKIVEPQFVQRGDICMFNNNGVHGLCLRLGLGFVGMTDTGCKQIDYPVIKAWRIA